MAFSIPKSTRISGMKWRIIPKRQVTLQGEECEGVCHPDTKVIELTVASGDEFTIMSTLYHELCHAMIDESGVKLTMTQEHAIIATMERWMATNLDFREKVRRPKKKKS